MLEKVKTEKLQVPTNFISRYDIYCLYNIILNIFDIEKYLRSESSTSPVLANSFSFNMDKLPFISKINKSSADITKSSSLTTTPDNIKTPTQESYKENSKEICKEDNLKHYVKNNKRSKEIRKSKRSKSSKSLLGFGASFNLSNKPTLGEDNVAYSKKGECAITCKRYSRNHFNDSDFYSSNNGYNFPSNEVDTMKESKRRDQYINNSFLSESSNENDSGILVEEGPNDYYANNNGNCIINKDISSNNQNQFPPSAIITSIESNLKARTSLNVYLKDFKPFSINSTSCTSENGCDTFYHDNTEQSTFKSKGNRQNNNIMKNDSKVLKDGYDHMINEGYGNANNKNYKIFVNNEQINHKYPYNNHINKDDHDNISNVDLDYSNLTKSSNISNFLRLFDINGTFGKANEFQHKVKGPNSNYKNGNCKNDKSCINNSHNTLIKKINNALASNHSNKLENVNYHNKIMKTIDKGKLYSPCDKNIANMLVSKNKENMMKYSEEVNHIESASKRYVKASKFYSIQGFRKFGSLTQNIRSSNILKYNKILGAINEKISKSNDDMNLKNYSVNTESACSIHKFLTFHEDSRLNYNAHSMTKCNSSFSLRSEIDSKYTLSNLFMSKKKTLFPSLSSIFHLNEDAKPPANIVTNKPINDLNPKVLSLEISPRVLKEKGKSSWTKNYRNQWLAEEYATMQKRNIELKVENAKRANMYNTQKTNVKPATIKLGVSGYNESLQAYENAPVVTKQNYQNCKNMKKCKIQMAKLYEIEPSDMIYSNVSDSQLKTKEKISGILINESRNDQNTIGNDKNYYESILSSLDNILNQEITDDINSGNRLSQDNDKDYKYIYLKNDGKTIDVCNNNLLSNSETILKSCLDDSFTTNNVRISDGPTFYKVDDISLRDTNSERSNIKDKKKVQLMTIDELNTSKISLASNQNLEDQNFDTDSCFEGNDNNLDDIIKNRPINLTRSPKINKGITRNKTITNNTNVTNFRRFSSYGEKQNPMYSSFKGRDNIQFTVDSISDIIPPSLKGKHSKHCSGTRKLMATAKMRYSQEDLNLDVNFLSEDHADEGRTSFRDEPFSDDLTIVGNMTLRRKNILNRFAKLATISELANSENNSTILFNGNDDILDNRKEKIKRHGTHKTDKKEPVDAYCHDVDVTVDRGKEFDSEEAILPNEANKVGDNKPKACYYFPKIDVASNKYSNQAIKGPTETFLDDQFCLLSPQIDSPLNITKEHGYCSPTLKSESNINELYSKNFMRVNQKNNLPYSLKKGDAKKSANKYGKYQRNFDKGKNDPVSRAQENMLLPQQSSEESQDIKYSGKYLYEKQSRGTTLSSEESSVTSLPPSRSDSGYCSWDNGLPPMINGHLVMNLENNCNDSNPNFKHKTIPPHRLDDNNSTEIKSKNINKQHRKLNQWSNVSINNLVGTQDPINIANHKCLDIDCNINSITRLEFLEPESLKCPISEIDSYEEYSESEDGYCEDNSVINYYLPLKPELCSNIRKDPTLRHGYFARLLPPKLDAFQLSTPSDRINNNLQIYNSQKSSSQSPPCRNNALKANQLIRQKSQEEKEYYELCRDMKSLGLANPNLRNILNQEVNEEVIKQMYLIFASAKAKSDMISSSIFSQGDTISNPKVSAIDDTDSMPNNDSKNILYQAKFLDGVQNKLKALKMMKSDLEEEVSNNNLTWQQMKAIISKLVKSQEMEKVYHYFDDSEKIICLLLSLSIRIFKNNQLLNSCIDTKMMDNDKEIYENRKSKLEMQYKDAMNLKLSIDKRLQLVDTLFSKYISESDCTKFQEYCESRIKLIIDQRFIIEKIKIGEEQLSALQNQENF
ncbi:unnamed protein product [Gordionus sp. m RMFG-2023]